MTRQEKLERAAALTTELIALVNELGLPTLTISATPLDDDWESSDDWYSSSC